MNVQLMILGLIMLIINKVIALKKEMRELDKEELNEMNDNYKCKEEREDVDSNEEVR